MPSYRSLLAQKASLDRKIQQARKREVSSVIKQINGLIEEYGLTPDELTFSDGTARPQQAKAKRGRRTVGAKSATAGITVAPKYRDPETGKTWTGRGRAPKWVVGDKEQYLIK
ncbi:H-NS histone family protein [Verticiella sediminum]|uniref:H-NS histone family protein n=1 Tax=Verticiella sediminum TaxID=1247510 RepID=A0A556B121_9BURK|nr:H-NS histone family protein [Verticiella sediminum]TSH98870.1 H-NS histone family protein [Verticiella sediminum]